MSTEVPAAPTPPARKLALHPWHAIWVIALGAVAWWISRQDAPHFPSSAAAIWELLGAVVIYAAATLLRAERWQRILRRNDVRVGRKDAYGLVLVGYMGNNVLPARGGELLRAFLLSRRGASKRGVLGTVIAERALDAVALGLLFVAFTVGVLGKVKLPSNTPLLIAVAAVAGLGLTGLGVLRFARSHHLVERAWTVLRPFATPARALMSLHGLALLALSMVIWGCEAGVYFAVADALGLDVGLNGALYVMVLANLFSLIPAAPGYVGTFDAAVIFAMGTAVKNAHGLVTSYLLLLRFVLFVPITVAGAVVLFTRYGGFSRYRDARAAVESEEKALADELSKDRHDELREPAATAV